MTTLFLLILYITIGLCERNGDWYRFRPGTKRWRTLLGEIYHTRRSISETITRNFYYAFYEIQYAEGRLLGSYQFPRRIMEIKAQIIMVQTDCVSYESFLDSSCTQPDQLLKSFRKCEVIFHYNLNKNRDDDVSNLTPFNTIINC